MNMSPLPEDPPAEFPAEHLMPPDRPQTLGSPASPGNGEPAHQTEQEPVH